MDFYDLQDVPYPWEGAQIEVWKPKAIGWSMRVAYELFSADLTAEKLAETIAKRYAVWCEELASEPAKIAKAQAAAVRKSAREAEVNLKRKNDLFLFKSLFFIVTATLVSVVYFIVSR